jgi:LysM repeat protein
MLAVYLINLNISDILSNHRPLIMKYLYFLPLGLALLNVSCENQIASSNPYQSNPYYGPNGSTYSSSSEEPSTSEPSTSYPSYSQSTYTPPTEAQTPAPSLPSLRSVPSYAETPPSYSGSAAAGNFSGPSSGKTHTVAGGENLYRISLANNTSVSAIKRENGLESDTIHPGQVLRIP